MTTDHLIDGILEQEGGFTENPADKGGVTNYGITARTLGEWRKLGRLATREEVRDLPIAEARAIYMARYVEPFLSIPFDELRAQLVDFGVLSGPITAIKILQSVLDVPVDGILGDRTHAALRSQSWPVVNNAVAALRIKRFVKAVEADASQKVFVWGWIRRAVRFIV